MIEISHFTVLVIGDDVEGQLAPYDEDIQVVPYPSYLDGSWLEHCQEEYEEEHGNHPNHQELSSFLNKKYDDEDYSADDKGVYTLSSYNPNSKWDWYQVGGRWRGYFKLKEAALDVAVTAEIGDPGVFDNDLRYDADVVCKGDVDVEGMRDNAGEAAGDRWDRVHAVIDELPEAESWETVRSRYEDSELEDARSEYHAQPRVVALKEHDTLARQEERHEDILLGFFTAVEEFQVPREQYVQEARDGALSPYAYLYRGEWFEPGRMGWFGMSSDTPESRAEYRRQFNEIFDSLPDETLLTLCDCHI